MASLLVRMLRGYINGGKNAFKKFFGTGMTDAETQAMTAEQNFNAEEAEKARNWQAEMDNTKYQRSVADMQSAGLNPALMYGSAGAGSTPSGASASSSVSAQPSGDLIGLIAQVAMQSKQLSVQKQIANQKVNLEKYITDKNLDMKARELELKAEANNIQSRSVDAQVSMIDSQIGLIAEQTKNEQLKGGLLDAQKKIADADAETKQAFADRAKELAQAELDLRSAQTKQAKAQAHLAYQEAAVAQMEFAYRKGFYTEETIDAMVKQVVNESKILQHELYQEGMQSYADYLKTCIVSGKPIQNFRFHTAAGKEVVIPKPSDEFIYNMTKSLGLCGPTSVNESWSSSWNTQYFGGQSESHTRGYSHSSGWRN